jgi:mycothiol synthase
VPRRECRRLTEDNLDDLIEVVDKSRADTPFHRRLTREEARLDYVADPDFDPDGTWLVYEEGEAVGFGIVVVEPARLEAGLNDGYVDVDVVPERRGCGIEQELLGKCIDRLLTMGIRKARSRSFASDGWRRSLLTSSSFESAYTVYTLVRRGDGDVEDVEAPEGYTIVRRPSSECTDADIIAIVESLNDSFSDHIDWAPEPPERFINLRDAMQHDSVFSIAHSDGAVAGFCWADIDPGLNSNIGEKAGWLGILGVNVSHRRRGLGRALMADGIRWILGQGMDTIYIQVFAENEKALELYRSLGFVNADEHLWFHKPLGGGAQVRPISSEPA